MPGLRLIDDILSGGVDISQRWQQVELGQLIQELASDAYLLTRAANKKFGAMYQAYRGLKILVMLTAVLVVMGAGDYRRPAAMFGTLRGAVGSALLEGCPRPREFQLTVAGEPRSYTVR